MLRSSFADFAHDVAAFRGRQHAPLFERFGGFVDYVVVVFFGGHAHFGDGSAFAGVEGDELSAGGLLDKWAVGGAGVDAFDTRFFRIDARISNSLPAMRKPPVRWRSAGPPHGRLFGCVRRFAIEMTGSSQSS